MEHAELPLRAVLGRRLARVFAELHLEHGVDLRCGVRRHAEFSADGGRRRGDPRGRHTVGPRDVVGVGAAPNVRPCAVVRAAGRQRRSWTMSPAHVEHPDIYAAGDVANAYHPLLARASERRALGRTHCTAARSPPGPCSANTSSTTGCRTSTPTSTTSAWSTPATSIPTTTTRSWSAATGPGRKFIAFWLSDGRVLAGMNVNVWDVDRRHPTADPHPNATQPRPTSRPRHPTRRPRRPESCTSIAGVPTRRIPAAVKIPRRCRPSATTRCSRSAGKRCGLGSGAR